MARLLAATGLRVARNKNDLALRLRPQLYSGRIRVLWVFLGVSLFFLFRIVFEVTRTDAPAAEGIDWSDVLLLAIVSAMLGYDLVREFGREVIGGDIAACLQVLRFRVWLRQVSRL